MRTLRDVKYLGPFIDQTIIGARRATLGVVTTLNVLLRNATLSRENDLAERVISRLLGTSPLDTARAAVNPVESTTSTAKLSGSVDTEIQRACGPERAQGEVPREPTSEQDRSPYNVAVLPQLADSHPVIRAQDDHSVTFFNHSRMGSVMSEPHAPSVSDSLVGAAVDRIVIAYGGEKLQPDVYSLTSILAHYSATSQFDKVERLVYKSIPFLNTRLPEFAYKPGASPAEDLRTYLCRRAAARQALRIPMRVWSQILASLEKSGKTGLAERVYALAKRSERASWPSQRTIMRSGGRAWPRRRGWLLPIEVYTVMIDLYGNELRAGSSGGKRRPGESAENPKTDVKGWAVGSAPPGTSRRKLAYTKMGDIYSAVCLPGHHPWWGFTRCLLMHGYIRHEDLPRPDARFFNAYIDKMRRLWRMSTGGSWKFRLQIAEEHLRFISTLQQDMERFGIPVPKGIREEEQSLHRQVTNLRQAITEGKSDRFTGRPPVGTGDAIPTWRRLVPVQYDRGKGRRPSEHPKSLARLSQILPLDPSDV